MSSEGIGWLELAVAAFLLVSAQLRPTGRHQTRSVYALGACMGLLGVARLISATPWVEAALLIAAFSLGLLSIVSSVLAFRSGELPFGRKSP